MQFGDLEVVKYYWNLFSCGECLLLYFLLFQYFVSRSFDHFEPLCIINFCIHVVVFVVNGKKKKMNE